MPPAARVGDMHTCPMFDGPKPHVARVGDMCTCVGPPDSIIMGSPTVLIGGMPAARMGDSTAHGGVIVMGCPTVIIN